MTRVLTASVLFLALGGDKVAWVESYDAALALARASGRPILVHLMAPVRGAAAAPEDTQVIPGC